MAYSPRKRRTFLSVFKVSIIVLASLALVSAVAGSSLFYYVLHLDLPSVSSLKD